MKQSTDWAEAMSLAWHEIALPTGTPGSGWLGMHITFTLPESNSNKPASDRQKDSIKIFYEQEFGELSFDQAHSLLSCRDFSRLSSELLSKEYPIPVRHLLSRALAAFILADPVSTDFVRRWGDNAYARGSSSPRVRNSPVFADLGNFATYLVLSIEGDGWTKELLRSF